MRRYLPILIATGLLLAGCGGVQPEKADAPEDIVGIWGSTSGSQYVRFTDDGTFHAEPSLQLVTSPIRDPGEYWFEGDELHLKTTGDPVCGDIEAIYEVRLLENGNRSFFAIDDSCGPRLAFFQGVIDEDTGEPSTEYRPVTDG